MPDNDPLLETFKHTAYQVSGHGRRQVHVLKDAMAEEDGNRDADIYGQGQIIEDFQNKIADYLGKESAVFFPSGTMAQQIALRIWCDRKSLKKVAYHPLCHLEIHEENGLRELHHIEPVLLADKDRLIELADVTDMPDQVAVLLLELPQREIGGQLPDFGTLEAISAFCRTNGIKLHLDGARLFEVLPYYQKTAADVCALFDSVYVSFYKGIGAIAGAMLAGPKDFVDEAKVWKRRHGGDLISLYPYILAADHYFDQRVGKMAQYYADAQTLAALFNGCHGVWTKPLIPVSNMFHVHFDFPKETVQSLLEDLYRTSDIGLTGTLREKGRNECSFEISIGDQYPNIPQEKLSQMFELLDSRLPLLP